MVLLLTNEEISGLLDMREVLAATEAAFRALGQGRAVVRPRTHTFIPLEATREYEFKSMEGGLFDVGVYALRIASDVLEHPVVDGKRRRVKLPTLPGGRFLGLILLFRTYDGALLAIMQDGLIQSSRVAATTAIAARYLARPESRTLALIGSGLQARAHALAMHSVFPLREVRVYSPRPGHRENFAQEMSRALGVPVRPTDRPEAAVSGADLVCVATNSSEPVLSGRWLEPGQFVSTIVGGDEKYKRRELDDEAVDRCHRIIVNDRDHARRVGQEDILHAVQRGRFTWDEIGELGQLVAGLIPGRQSPEEIVLFKNNVGLGVQFAAVGYMVYQKALAAGVGRRLPLEWFTQTIHP